MAAVFTLFTDEDDDGLNTSLMRGQGDFNGPTISAPPRDAPNWIIWCFWWQVVEIGASLTLFGGVWAVTERPKTTRKTRMLIADICFWGN